MSGVTCYADLHIHIGRAGGRTVKVTASDDLTLPRIIEYVPRRKGLAILGIVDAASPLVQQEFVALIEEGMLTPVKGGGLAAADLLLVPAAEIELPHNACGSAHYLAYFPGLEEVKAFAAELKPFMTNPNLSTQLVRLTPGEAYDLAAACGGFLIPAHAFTPHKGVLGACAANLVEVFGERALIGLELGLSADTQMADTVSGLCELTFLTSSDAHSLAKIGREYMQFSLQELNFSSLEAALRRQGPNRVIANYGLAPKLGKYHRTYCPVCNTIFTDPHPVLSCPGCPQDKLVLGVWDRLQQIADQPSASPSHRPPYVYQVPLEMLPGLGPKSIQRLIDLVGPEKYVLNTAPYAELAQAIGRRGAEVIIAARSGALTLVPGGGGRYGRVRLH